MTPDDPALPCQALHGPVEALSAEADADDAGEHDGAPMSAPAVGGVETNGHNVAGCSIGREITGSGLEPEAVFQSPDGFAGTASARSTPHAAPSESSCDPG